MTKCSVFPVLIFVILTVILAEGSRILIVNPYGTKSHQNTYVPLTKELVKQGHQITVISNYVNDELTQLGNVYQIIIKELEVDLSIFPTPFPKPMGLSEKIKTSLELMQKMFAYPSVIAETTYGNPEVKQLFSKETFDLVMFSEVCGITCYPFGWTFKAPTIVLSPNVMFPGRAEKLGGDEDSSYVPVLFSTFSDRMNFKERLINLISTKFFQFLAYNMHRNTVESIFKRMVDSESPVFYEMEKNFTLVFTNTHPAFTYPRSLPPQVIEVGGIHCRPANPLPKDLEAFVTESDAGFILFGIGSALKMEDMPEDVVQSFIKAFARLPQRVIWQWKGEIRSDLPKNVLAIPWLPQQDLLGHRNCRAFLTHGGLNSLQEAVYHGVPVLGLPSGNDQTNNVERAVKDGYALKLEWTAITEETLSNTIQELLHNPSYKTVVSRRSSLFRDQMQSPLERAVFWTEFLLRHKGADHLRLGSIDLAPYQRALIDVYIFLALCAVLPLLMTYFCVRKCCRKKNVSPQKKRN